MGIKDVLQTKDMPTQYGSELYAGNFPRQDNAAVWALRQAGAVIVGKTVTAELAGPQPGPTTNPFNKNHTPGGSSSGSGAAIGAGMVPACIATQSASSLLRPASFNGAWGIKVSQGAINRGERQTGSTTTHGVVAATFDDMWQVAIEIAKRAGGDPGRTALRGPDTPPPGRAPLVLAVMETEGWSRLDDATHAAFDEVLAQVRAEGVSVVRRGDDEVLESFEQALVGLTALTNSMLGRENWWALRDMYEAHPDRLSARGRHYFIERGQELGADGYERALRQQTFIKEAHHKLANRYDALIAPTSAGPAPEWTGDDADASPSSWPTGDPVFGTPPSLLGAPSINVPLIAVDGLPLGIQVMGQHGTDARMAAIGHWLRETVTPVTL